MTQNAHQLAEEEEAAEEHTAERLPAIGKKKWSSLIIEIQNVLRGQTNKMSRIPYMYITRHKRDNDNAIGIGIERGQDEEG